MLSSWAQRAGRLRTRGFAAACALLLAGCGGGLYLEFGDYDDEPPRVELAAASSSVQPGQTVRLVAAATDDYGVSQVLFYRYDGNTPVLLGNDAAPPYDHTMVAPSDGRSSVTVFARAVDHDGQSADSALVTVAIGP